LKNSNSSERERPSYRRWGMFLTSEPCPNTIAENTEDKLH